VNARADAVAADLGMAERRYRRRLLACRVLQLLLYQVVALPVLTALLFAVLLAFDVSFIALKSIFHLQVAESSRVAAAWAFLINTAAGMYRNAGWTTVKNIVNDSAICIVFVGIARCRISILGALSAAWLCGVFALLAFLQSWDFYLSCGADGLYVYRCNLFSDAIFTIFDAIAAASIALGCLATIKPEAFADIVTPSLSSLARALFGVPECISYASRKAATSALLIVGRLISFIPLITAMLVLIDLQGVLLFVDRRADFLRNLGRLVRLSVVAVADIFYFLARGDMADVNQGFNILVPAALGLGTGFIFLVASLGVSLGCAVLAFWLIGKVCRGCSNLARRFLTVSLERVLKLDQRKPILFLRAFADDQVLMRPIGVLTLLGLFDFNDSKMTLDQLLLQEGTLYGPVVALGNPRDKLPPFGVARGYFANENWQEAVANLVRDSSAVVICVDETEGISWELEFLRDRRFLVKTLFLLHPKFAGPAANATMTAGVVEKLQLGMTPGIAGRGKASRVIGFSLDDDGAMRTLYTRTFSRFSYLLALRMFLRGRFGVPTGLSAG
jgi:hypothetical protein